VTQSPDSSQSTLLQAATHGEEGALAPARYRPTKRGRRWTMAAAAGVLGLLSLAGVLPRVLHRADMAEEARSVAGEPASVSVVRVERSTEASNLSLPGSVEALQETSVYARANGYVRAWLVDIGAHVRKGQTLAELEVPDVDEELRQQQAAANQALQGVTQAKTQLELARTTNRRYGALGPTGVVSQQEVDQYQAAYDAQRANVAAAEAAHGSTLAGVRRLQDLKSFGVLVAPFDGVVTLRTAEVGQLVTSGTGMGQPLFKVAEVDTVRVFVNVPQLYASAIQPGMHATMTVSDLSSRVFDGTVARTSNELDVGTRTLRTEVDLPNPEGALIAGMYGRVSFHFPGPRAVLFVPATSVLIDARGTRVARVRAGVLSWVPVEIESDLGDKLAISAGLSEGDVAVLAPSDRLTEGMRVRARSN